jgi:membrane protein DedA with SNARE-associated domain
MIHAFALIFGTLISEDLTCIAAGLLVSRGETPLVLALSACVIGIYAGDLGLWAAGRLIGARVLAWPRVMAVLPAKRAERFAAWFDARAARVIVASRFAPGTRLPLYLAAGACQTSFATFAKWSLVAVTAWTPLLVGLSALLGAPAAARVGESLIIARLGLVAAALVGVCVWRTVLGVATVRGRQRAIAAVQRIWRWEFWPMWLFYAPVAAWTAWLALRYGGFRTITAANPGIPDGGVVGESKLDILSRLPQEWIVPSAAIEPADPEARVAALAACMNTREWCFPMILKPDVGQRGTGVRLAHGLEDAARYFSRVGARVLVQPYHPGPFEAGIFYYRMPGEGRGRILTITDKHFPTVTGDGRSSIADLVWAHPRHRMQARTFLARFGTRATDVPGPGEVVRLAIAGNHAQGTLFKDGRALITPALEARIDAIAREYDGFFIGRFDVRYRDRAAFTAGRDLAIVELNGATAECTNIYDPDGRLLSAYRQLFRQWRLVFAIGAANRRRGRTPSSRQRLATLLLAHLSSNPAFPVSD